MHTSHLADKFTLTRPQHFFQYSIERFAPTTTQHVSIHVDMSHAFDHVYFTDAGIRRIVTKVNVCIGMNA